MINLRNSRAARVREVQAQHRVLMSHEVTLSRKVSHELNHVADAAARNYEDHKNAHLDDIIPGHRYRLGIILKTSMKQVGHTFSRRVIQAMPKGMGVWPFSKLAFAIARKASDDEIQSSVDRFIEEHVGTQVKDISATTRTRIVNAISKGEEGDVSDADIAKMIRRAGGGAIGDARARTIARTEMHTVANAASEITASELEIPGLQKEWLTAGDDRVRDDHWILDGERVEMDESFTVGEDELDYPGDPSGSPEEIINCRCVLAYRTERRD